MNHNSPFCKARVTQSSGSKLANVEWELEATMVPIPKFHQLFGMSSLAIDKFAASEYLALNDKRAHRSATTRFFAEYFLRLFTNPALFGSAMGVSGGSIIGTKTSEWD